MAVCASMEPPPVRDRVRDLCVRTNLVGRHAGCVTCQPLLAGFQKLLRPTMIEVLIDPFLPAQLGDALLAAQAFQNNPDLLFRQTTPARRTPDNRQCCRSGERSMDQQSSREFQPAVSATRRVNFAHQRYENSSEHRRRPRFDPQPLQPGPSSLQPLKLQTQWVRLHGRVASTCGLRSTDYRVLQTSSRLSDSTQTWPRR